MAFPEEGLDAEHLRQVMAGYRARVISENQDLIVGCPYDYGSGSFYFMWMNGWHKAEADMNCG